MRKQKTTKILEALDKEYGVTKEGFAHEADWQLLIAIMLSAQNTEKQVVEALPGLWRAFPTLEKIVGAPIEALEQSVKSVGFYKVKARNMQKCCK